MNFVFLLLLSFPALAAKIELWPVGEFGGYRVITGCEADKIAFDCLIDTASTYSVFASTPFSQRYPSLGKVTLVGIAGNMECDEMSVGRFSLGEEEQADARFLRCQAFPPASSPLIGLDFFRGKNMRFSFREKNLSLGNSITLDTTPFEWLGRRRTYISFPGTIESLPAKMFFDTGAPVTMVSHEFVAAHPTYFRRSSRPPSAMMLRNGFVAYESQRPVVVNGVPLSAEYVYGADLSRIVGDTQIDVILGANHLVGADWEFDLTNSVFRVSR